MSLPAAEVYVVSGNLLSTTPSVADPTVLEDILHSNLLCQLAADKSLGSRFVDPAAWLDFYRNSLGKIFWKITNSNTASYPVPPLLHSITVMKVLENTFFKVLERDLRNRIEESIELFGGLSESSPPSLLFNLKTHVDLNPVALFTHSQVHSVSVVNLQISVVHSGTRVSVCSVYFKTSEPVGDDVFNQRFLVKELLGNVSVSSFEANLLEASYAVIRQQIIDKLGEKNILENILSIPADSVPLTIPPHAGARQFVEGLDI